MVRRVVVAVRAELGVVSVRRWLVWTALLDDVLAGGTDVVAVVVATQVAK